MSAIDMILDDDNAENIVMYNENNEPVEFQQIAVIPLQGNVFVILRPAGEVEGIGEDEALVFAIDEVDGEECLTIVEDDEAVDLVFEEYYKMLREAGINI